MDMGLQNSAEAAGQTWPGASLRVADFFMALRWKKEPCQHRSRIFCSTRVLIAARFSARFVWARRMRTLAHLHSKGKKRLRANSTSKHCASTGQMGQCAAWQSCQAKAAINAAEHTHAAQSRAMSKTARCLRFVGTPPVRWYIFIIGMNVANEWLNDEICLNYLCQISPDSPFRGALAPIYNCGSGFRAPIPLALARAGTRFLRRQ